jgi:hypothetical protein
MQRTCGKKNCRCQQGQKHAALYLAIRSGNRRMMIYVPPALEGTIRRWVETGSEETSSWYWATTLSQRQLSRYGVG